MVWGDGEQIRNWTHVSDIVRGTILAAETIDDGAAVNLGTMERTRVIDAAREVLRYTGIQPGSSCTPRCRRGRSIALRTIRWPAGSLGWEPQLKFVDGLHQTIDWYRRANDRAEVAASLAGRLTERGAGNVRQVGPRHSGLHALSQFLMNST